MKRTMSMALVLGLLAAGLAVHAARAQEPEGPLDDPMADVGGDFESGPGMHGGDMEHGPGPGAMMRHGPGFRRGRMGGGAGLGPRMAEELNLTTEQREKMKAAREREQRKAIQTRADIQLARLDLRKLMQADKPDQKAIDAQIDRIAGLRTGLEKSRVATMLEFRASLTPEQQKKLKELREQGPRRARPSNSPRQGGGGGGI
jgi:Spy/CpxP family protein refolding chaperone